MQMLDWAVKLGFAMVGICVATIHILRLRREKQDRELWLQDMAERQKERAAREQERAERQKERARRAATEAAAEDREARYRYYTADGAMY